jgi:hypothetical protein
VLKGAEKGHTGNRREAFGKTIHICRGARECREEQRRTGRCRELQRCPERCREEQGRAGRYRDL